MLNNLDLFKIRLISQLVKYESLSKAAQQLGVTSSAVSQNVRSLERSLGKPLFMRVGKGIKPTGLAIEIAKRAQPFFLDIATILQDSHERIAEIRIGAPSVFGTTLLLDRLEHVRNRFPGVRICLTLFDTKRILAELFDGKLDFGFVDGGPHLKKEREIATVPFSTEILSLCCSREFYQSHLKKSQNLKTLKTLPHIPYHQDKEGIHKWYLHHYGRVPDFPWTLAVDNPYGVLKAVLKGWGLGVVPQGLLFGNDQKIITLSGPKSEFKSEILLAQNKSKIPTKMENTIISLLLQK